MRIAITSPAGKVDSEKLAKGVSFLKSCGYEIVLGQTLQEEEFWTAGSAELRSKEFQDFWLDDDVDAVWAARGGFGCAHLLDIIDWGGISGSESLLLGHSDISVFHLAFLKYGISRSISAAMPAVELSTKVPDPLTVNSTLSLLSGDLGFLKAELRECEVLSAGSARGRLIPVTLSVLCSLCGTSYLPDFKDSILVLEDVNESPYRIDSYMNQLRLNGILSSLSGLILGDFRNCGSELDLEYVYNKYKKEVRGPVLKGLAFGHCDPRLSLPVGEEVAFNAVDNVIEV